MNASSQAFVVPSASLASTLNPVRPLRCSNFSRRGPFRPARRTHIQPHVACASSSKAPPSSVLSVDELKVSLAEQVHEAVTALQAADNIPTVEKLRVQYLGKKGSITVVMRMVGKLSAEDRPALGAAVNSAKEEVSALVAERKQSIEDAAIAEKEESEWIDVTMPGIRPHKMIGRRHPITTTMRIATDIFVNIGYDLIDDFDLNREVETDFYCFTALNCPPGHPAREMQDTFYITPDQKNLLRTQTSAVQIRYMEKNKPPFKIIAPGRVYRRDTVDATHSSTFHQIEILAMDRKGVLNFGSLKATVEHFLREMLGADIETRFRGSYFPFTEPSVEVDVYFRGKWLEVLGCGMVDPAVLENVGLDPKEWCGFAAGFGVERFAMVMHEIPDIRELYRNDSRFLTQFMTE